MNRFAFIIHPLDPKRDVQRKFPLLGKVLPVPLINFFSTFFPAVYLSKVEGVTSQATGEQVEGWLLACPLTAARMLELPERIVYHKVIQTGRLAERLGAQLLGLGAFTSVVGDGGLTIARALDVPVTTGDAYTIAVAVDALLEAARAVGLPVERVPAAVVGASGAIGRVCASLLAERVEHLILIAPRRSELERVASALRSHSAARLSLSTEVTDVAQARMVLTVSSAARAIIRPEHLAPGSVVCDVARPRDVSAMVAAVRPDVLVIDGGVVSVPGPVDFHFDFGLPPGMTYACMAETMALALEGRLEDYTLGKQIERWRVDEISAIARRHGFTLGGFRSFEKPVSEAQIEAVRRVVAHHYPPA
ncbi:MAG: shikimate dehydrogenase [Anaerolineae bacterium]|nr:MAG: shikimate dehydrogenase [Anaerolineae bacterium]